MKVKKMYLVRATYSPNFLCFSNLKLVFDYIEQFEKCRLLTGRSAAYGAMKRRKKLAIRTEQENEEICVYIIVRLDVINKEVLQDCLERQARQHTMPNLFTTPF